MSILHLCACASREMSTNPKIHESSCTAKRMQRAVQASPCMVVQALREPSAGAVNAQSIRRGTSHIPACQTCPVRLGNVYSPFECMCLL